MEVVVLPSYEEMSRAAAQVVADVLNAKPNAVLGMATGSTPLGLYQELVRMHREEGLDFTQVTTFNLDEYVGLRPEHRAKLSLLHAGEFFPACEHRAGQHLHSIGHDEQLPLVLRVVRAADRRVRRDRRADSGHRLGRAHRVQRTGQLALVAHAAEDAGQVDD